MAKPSVGKSINRLDGKAKVTGAAKYSGEYNVADLLYGYVVNSRITKGKIRSIDTSKAKGLDGVVEVFTHENRPRLAWLKLKYKDLDAPSGSAFQPLHDSEIKFNGQPIALVVAEDFETARYAATLVDVQYEEETFETCLETNLHNASDQKNAPKPTGDFEKAYEKSAVRVSNEYMHSTEHHNPIELFATTTIYEGEGKLTIYDKTQWTINNQVYIANVFGLHFKDVRVLAPFVGGAFGSGLRPQYQLFLCVLAALQLKRNVRVTLDRHQMFPFAHRPPTYQKTRFSADSDGKIMAMNHLAISETSEYEDKIEEVVSWSHRLYPAPNTLFQHKLAPLSVHTPLDMRAPGASTGMHAIECTMDELAYKLNIDPLDFRIMNYSENDPSEDKPFTSKELKQCYERAAAKFGWRKRSPIPGSMRNGNKLVGYGMASGIWEVEQYPSRVEAIINEEGRLEIHNATTDIGTGTFTVITQIAADELGLALDDVIFSYGDSKKPFSPSQGGSSTTASAGVAVVTAVRALKAKLLKAAKSISDSRLKKLKDDEVSFADGNIILKVDQSPIISFREIIAANKGKEIKTTNLGKPPFLKLRKYSKASHSAAFVEVEIDEDLKTINVTRAVTAVAAGKIINPKTARSQILGSMVWSISKALREETILDQKLGRYMNSNLGEYHIPVHADIHDLQVIFADENDELINELGVKGVGEIGMIAMPAAIANAIFHATGKRINNLPIHFDELM